MGRTFPKAKTTLLPFAIGAAGIMTHDPAVAQQAPTNLAADEAIVLQTTTPLGQAKIAIAPGTVLTNFEIQGERVRVWQGPFSATVDLSNLQTPAPQPVATAAPSPVGLATPAATAASPEPAAVPVPESSPVPTPQPAAASSAESAPWPLWVPPVALGALALYALVSTVALLRARRRAANAKPAEAPVIIMPKANAAKPAIVSEGGRAIVCPLCAANIPREKISQGRNTCPSCSRQFVCE